MNSSTKFSLFISILLLVSLFTSFNEVNSLAIDKKKDFCTGFEFTSPEAGAVVKNGAKTTVSWTRGGSEISKVAGAELFTEDGKYLKSLWDGSVSLESGSATESIDVDAPSSLKLPAKVMLRSWGFTDKGPNCFKLSKVFTLE